MIIIPVRIRLLNHFSLARISKTINNPFPLVLSKYCFNTTKYEETELEMDDRTKRSIYVTGFLVTVSLLILVFILIIRQGEEEGESPKERIEDVTTPRRGLPLIQETTKRPQRDIPKIPTSTPVVTVTEVASETKPTSPVLAMLYGRITNEDEEPLPGVRVEVEIAGVLQGISAVIAQTSTDKSGEYHFKSLPVATLFVIARSPGHLIAKTTAEFSPGILSLRKDFVLHKGGLSLAGRVINEKGKPVRGARLFLRYPESLFSSFCFEETSDENGRFRFDGLWKGFANLSVSATRYTAWHASQVEIGADDMTIVLNKKGAKIFGAVRTRVLGKPVPDAAVIVKGHGLWDKGSLYIYRTDSEGKYETNLLSPGKYYLSVSYGRRSSANSDVRFVYLVPEGPEEVLMDLTLYDFYRVRGIVKDDDTGQPIAGAVIQSVKSGSSSDPISHAVKTDAEGRFLLENCLPLSFYGKEIRLKANAERYRRISKDIYLHEKIDLPPVEIRMRKGIAVHGTVFGPEGNPACGAKVRLMWKEKGFDHIIKSDTISDQSGQYHIVIYEYCEKEEMNFLAYHPDFGFAILTVVVKSENGEFHQDLFLESGALVKVKVLDDDSRGVKGFSVRAEATLKRHVEFKTSLVTDYKGVANFANLPCGLYVFKVENIIYRYGHNKKINLEYAGDKKELTFHLSDADFRVFGVVTDEQRNPLPGVSVMSTYYGEKVKTDDSGHYDLGLYTGERDQITFAFMLDGYAEERTKLKIEGEARPLDVVMKKQEPFILFGTVRASDGTIPAEVYIEIFKDGRRTVWTRGTYSLTGNGGFEIQLRQFEFKIGSVYKVMASHPELGKGASNTLVAKEPGRLGPFEITLVP